MVEKNIITQILEELDLAIAKHPDWPDDIIHQSAIVAEESGEVIKAALQYKYEKGHLNDLEKELRQTAAMCIRMLNYLQIKYPK